MDTLTAQTVNAAGYTKEQILLMKNAIKSKVAEQKSLKPQRKTVHFSGERTVSPSQATWQHRLNRYELRHMYYAYAIMRGKDPMIGETKTKENNPVSQMKIEQILKTFSL
jgi:tRNA splicing ligase